jgi:hypothetical protein
VPQPTTLLRGDNEGNGHNFYLYDIYQIER